MTCDGQCKNEDEETCYQPHEVPGEEPGETETEEGGLDLESTAQIDCETLSCEEENGHPSQSTYHDWIMEMLQRTQ